MTKHRLHVEDDNKDTMIVTQHNLPGTRTQPQRTAQHKTLAELLNNFKTLVNSCTYGQASQKKF